METFIAILALVWSILCLILFFKIWGMTNDVKEILKCLQKPLLKEVKNEEKNESKENLTDALVVEKKTEKQMRVKSITPEGKFSCYQGMTHYGDLSRDEFILFEEYVKKMK